MPKKIRISIGADHAGFLLKKDLIKYLREEGHEVSDRGTKSGAKSVDYPDFAMKVVSDVLSSKADKGILVCGTGIGMAISANRFVGIRAAAVYDVTMAELAAKHNNANILCLGARLTAPYLARLMVQKWLDSRFETRHKTRLKLIDQHARCKEREERKGEKNLSN